MSSILSLTVLVAVLMINTISVVLPALSRTFTSAPAWRRIEAAAAFPLMADTRMRGVQRDTLSITSTCQSTKTHALNWQYRVKLTIWQSNGPQTVHQKKKENLWNSETEVWLLKIPDHMKYLQRNSSPKNENLLKICLCNKQIHN